MILEVNKLNSSYGVSQILFGVSLQVDTSETVCVLGRNGVGKTTTLKTIIGMIKPLSGSIKFHDKELAGLPAYKVCRAGVSYIPQGRHIFPNLSTRENLLIAERKGKDPATQWTLEKIYKLFPVLKSRESFKGRSLSGGEQQMLTIARGLMQNPTLLLMDEITEGLAPIIVKELEEIVQELQKSGVSILVAEQNIKFAMAISSRCYILEKGQVVYNGKTQEVPRDIVLKYLGT